MAQMPKQPKPKVHLCDPVQSAVTIRPPSPPSAPKPLLPSNYSDNLSTFGESNPFAKVPPGRLAICPNLARI